VGEGEHSLAWKSSRNPMAWGSVAPGADLSGLTLSLAFLCYTREKIDTRWEGEGNDRRRGSPAGVADCGDLLLQNTPSTKKVIYHFCLRTSFSDDLMRGLSRIWAVASLAHRNRSAAHDLWIGHHKTLNG
jgi:hypothetical protein